MINNTTIILVLAFLIPNVSSGQIEIDQLDPAEYFDFWIGNWDLTWKQQDGTDAKGQNTIKKIMNDKVIEEDFKALQGNISGFAGKSWSVYDPNNKVWKQTWVDNQGSYLDFEGKIVGNKRIFIREAVRPDGTKMHQRMVFYDIKGDSFTWDWEISNDSGKTWNLQWKIYYKRME